MKKEDLIVGNLYHILENHHKNQKDEFWIVKFNGFDPDKPDKLMHSGCIVTSEGFHPDPHGWGNFSQIALITPASEEEILWFDMCIKQGKFIPKPIFPSHLIFN